MSSPLLKGIGNTPLVRLEAFERRHDLPFEVYAKMEMLNPSGSVKDRPALWMVEEAERRGEIEPGDLLVEATSGNMGISLAMVAREKGYRLRIYMPSSASIERRKMMEGYGAELVLTTPEGGMAEAKQKALEVVRNEGAKMLGQFENLDNAKAHHETTGPEIEAGFAGDFDAFLAGIGTGGTFTGTVSYLRERGHEFKAYAVEPKESPLLNGGDAHPHGIEGIGANFVPAVLDRKLIDETVDVTFEESCDLVRELSREDGIKVGISAGAVLAAVLHKKNEIKPGGKAVVIFPDGADRYLSKKGLY